ncbi:MAG: anti-sigma factor [Clostridia bacterium]|jgi:hypothetical protein|nr:anti-sigma factor [Clostridia bacterium]MDH7572485.1 anti-sigma factor [Clostridia bacterium]
MKCRKARQLLSPYIDGELAPQEQAALEEHLAACEACRAELEELRAVSDVLGEIFCRLEPPPGLLERTLNRIRELEAAGEIERLRRQDRRARWRRVTVGVGLAAGIGLAALQIGRAGVAPVPQPPAPVAVAPGPGITAEDPAEVPKEQAPAPAPQVAAEHRADGGRKVAPEVMSAAPESEAGRTEGAESNPSATVRPARVAAQAAQPAPTKERKAPAAGESRVALADGAPGPSRTFLSHGRHVRTTVLRLAVADLEAARLAVAAAAIEARAAAVEEAWSYQQEQLMLRVVLPVTGAARFVAGVSGLGEVLGRSTETADVTAEFERRLAEYRELSAKSDPESQALAKAAEKVLEALDRESLEAGREVVNVWLALR